MNSLRIHSSRFSRHLRVSCRQFCSAESTKSSSSLNQMYPPIDYQSPSELLSESSLQQILSQNSLTASSKMSENAQFAVLQHLSKFCRVPIRSNVIDKLETPEQAVQWFSKQITPCAARPHARELISNTLGEEVSGRIDLERDQVQLELEKEIPSNLVLDERTFLKPEKPGLRMKRKYVTARR